MEFVDKCINCTHCHKTKELRNKEWIEQYVCTMWLDFGEKKEPLLMTIGYNANSLCEMFEKRRVI